jgi:hypothetical protein
VWAAPAPALKTSFEAATALPINDQLVLFMGYSSLYQDSRVQIKPKQKNPVF